MAVKLTYDPEADAIYIQLSDVPPHEGDDAGPMTLHYSEDDKVVGIEILSASRLLAPGDWSKWPLPGVEPRVHAAE